MSTDQYRNVSMADDGTITGERLIKTPARTVLAIAEDAELPETFDLQGPEFWVSFTTNIEGEVIKRAYYGSEVGFRAILALQDGYGTPGYIPPQGPDWSGCRDSTPEAWALMFAVAQSFVSVEQCLTELGLGDSPV